MNQTPGNQSIQWENMRPLTLIKGQLEDFPVSELPPVIEDYVLSVSEVTQTHPDMASIVALGVLSVCNQRKFQVWNGYFEPLNLYTLLVAEPGERKSAVVQLFTKYLQEFQHLENENRRDDINRYNIKKEVLENEVKHLKDTKKKPDHFEELLLEKTRELQNLKAVKPLRLFCDDCTAEAFVGLLEKNDGMMSVISAEGGIFDIMGGRYNDVPNIDVFLKGYSGEEIIVDRKSSGSLTVQNPALTFVLAIQPNVLEKMMKNPVFEGRGLLARFLYSVPISTIGTRSYDTIAIPQERERNYRTLVHTLLSVPVPDTPTTLTLSVTAQNVMRAYFQQIEVMLKKENSIKNWLAKHIGSVLRIAGNLHLASENSNSREISEETLCSAIKIGKYFANHARYSFLSVTGEEEILKAKELLHIIFKLSRDNIVTRREVYRRGGRRNLGKIEEMLPYLDFLEDYGYIKQIHAPISATSTRPSDIIYIHPSYAPD